MFSLAGAVLAATLLLAVQVGGIDRFAPSDLYPKSVFKRPIPANARIAPNSGALIARLLARGGGATDFRNDAAGGDWNTPIYVSSAKDPAYIVKCDQYGGGCNVKNAIVHIPAYAKAEHKSDAHLTIIDPVSGYEYNFWQAARNSDGDLNIIGGTLHISWGGRSKIGGDGTNAEGNHAGFAASAVTLYPAEILAGRIDHALAIGVYCADDPAVFPAILMPTDQACGVPNSPYYGMHVQLNLSDAEIAALRTSPLDKAIKTALAHYGAYVYDTGNPQGINVLALSYLTYTTQGLPDPWLSTILPQLQPYGIASGGGDRWQLSPIFGGVGIDWMQRLRVIAPCVDAKTC
jgi:hypothetical protein